MYRLEPYLSTQKLFSSLGSWEPGALPKRAKISTGTIGMVGPSTAPLAIKLQEAPLRMTVLLWIKYPPAFFIQIPTKLLYVDTT
jgi:hypothetical protein